MSELCHNCSQPVEQKRDDQTLCDDVCMTQYDKEAKEHDREMRRLIRKRERSPF